MPPAPTHANTHECQPATGSLCRSRSNNSSLPSFCEYSRFKILNHVLCSRSATWGADFCLATMPSKSNPVLSTIDLHADVVEIMVSVIKECSRSTDLVPA